MVFLLKIIGYVALLAIETAIIWTIRLFFPRHGQNSPEAMAKLGEIVLLTPDPKTTTEEELLEILDVATSAMARIIING